MKRTRLFLSLALLAGLVAPRSVADGRFAPVGPEFQVPAWVMRSVVAMDAAANVVVAWTDARDAYARRFDASGRPRDPALLVYGSPPGWSVMNVQVAAATDGSFVVVWLATAYGLEQRLGYATYDSQGAPTGAGVVVEPPAAATGAALACAPDGTFVVAWQQVDAEGETVRAQVFDAKGAPQGAAFRVDSATAYARSPYVAADSAGGFFVAWTQDGLGLARKFSAGGVPVGEPFDVGYVTSICAGPPGVLVGVTYRASGTGSSYFARRYDDGVPLGPELQVNQTPVTGNPWVRVACAAGGEFVTVWERQDTGEATDIFARRFTAAAEPDSPEFRVNDRRGGRRCNPAVASDPAGDFVAVWHVFVDTGPYEEGRIFRVAPPPRAKGDFDGDGHPDLVLRRVDDGRVRVWALHEAVRTRNLVVWPPTPDWAWHLGGVDDFNADGHADLVLRHQATGEVDVWLLGGEYGIERIGHATFTGAALPPADWIVAATADFDGDSRPDVLWRDRFTGKLAVWLMNGTGWRATVVPVPDQAADLNWVVVAAADFDGDGHCDLLWYNTSSGRVVQWLLDASLTRILGRFTSPAAAGDANWSVAAASDYGFGTLGQAGTADLVWRNDTTGKLVVWFMDRQGARTSGVFTTPEAPADPLAWTVVGPR